MFNLLDTYPYYESNFLRMAIICLLLRIVSAEFQTSRSEERQ
jgi:hypothetical protein